MQKRKKHLLWTLIVSAVMMLLMSMTALAEKTVYKAVTLEPGRSAKTKANTTTTDSSGQKVTTIWRYKAVADANGYFVVHVNSKKPKELMLQVYEKLNDPEYMFPEDDDEDTGRQGYYLKTSRYDTVEEIFAVPVEKGNYYMRASHGYDIAGISMSYFFVKSEPGNNYCRMNAPLLNAKKKRVVCQSKRFNYDRWYKIRLTKTQRIRVYFDFDDRSSDILLYDFKGNEIPTRYVMVYNNEGRQENCYARSKKQLPKGTYFLVIKHARDRYDYFTTRFWWK